MELEFENAGFWVEGKTGVPGEKPLGAVLRTNNKSTHISRRVRESNRSFIDGR